jgi:predicted esterase
LIIFFFKKIININIFVRLFKGAAKKLANFFNWLLPSEYVEEGEEEEEEELASDMEESELQKKNRSERTYYSGYSDNDSIAAETKLPLLQSEGWDDNNQFDSQAVFSQ